MAFSSLDYVSAASWEDAQTPAGRSQGGCCDPGGLGETPGVRCSPARDSLSPPRGSARAASAAGTWQRGERDGQKPRPPAGPVQGVPRTGFAPRRAARLTGPLSRAPCCSWPMAWPGFSERNKAKRNTVPKSLPRTEKMS